jgi:hypothetical protein
MPKKMSYEDFKKNIIAQLDDKMTDREITDEQRGKIARLRARILIDLL